MNSNSAIPGDLVPVVLEKASRLYQQQHSSKAFSLEELMAAGANVQIPPELIQQAYQQLQQEQREANQRQIRLRRRLVQGGVIAAAFSLATAL